MQAKILAYDFHKKGRTEGGRRVYASDKEIFQFEVASIIINIHKWRSIKILKPDIQLLPPAVRCSLKLKSLSIELLALLWLIFHTCMRAIKVSRVYSSEQYR